MLLTGFIVISLTVNFGYGNLYDFVVEKDEEVREVFTGPHGKETDLYNAMKEVANSYQLLANHLRAHNTSVVPVARRLYDRGVPDMILEVFRVDDLRAFFNWHQTDMDYFQSLYSKVQEKWRTFEKEFRNMSL